MRMIGKQLLSFKIHHEKIQNGQDSERPWIYSSSSGSMQPRIGFTIKSFSKYSVKKDIPGDGMSFF